MTSLLNETRSLLITLLVTNMTVNVVYFVVSTVLLMRASKSGLLGPAGLAVCSIVPLIGLILLGEVLPKLVASRLAEGWSHYASLPLLAVHRALTPLRVLVNSMVITPLARLIAPRDEPPSLSAEELESLLTLSKKTGVIDRHEERLLQEVLELSQLKVRHLMTPRVDIVAYRIGDGPDRLLELIRTTRKSHLPVYDGDLDHIKGIVHARQVLLKRPASNRELQPLIRQITFVPELQRADQLLVHFRKSGTNLAIAVDEYGGTAGLVTLEDVVEQMVGQIAGPHETAHEPDVQPLGTGLWRVDGDLPIREWADAFLPEAQRSSSGWTPDGFRSSVFEGISTLGGLVMAKLGRLPQVGDRVVIGNLDVQVDAMARRRIEWLTIRLNAPGQAPIAPSTEASPGIAANRRSGDSVDDSPAEGRQP